ncbi:MAG: DMT family transporter [bacterium]|nr:DMT family transporter [bacterium]
MSINMKSTHPTDAIKRTNRRKAIALMCVAVNLFGVLDTLAKYLANDTGLPVTQIIWVRFAGNILLNLLMFGPLLLLATRNTPHKWIHFVRSLLMATTTGFNFLALKYLQLDQTVTMFFIAPLIVAALGGPLLGEWIGWRRFLAILLGFTGVLFITRIGFGGVHYAMIYSLGAALTYALYMISTRYISKLEGPELMQITAPLAGFMLFAPLAYAHWIWPPTIMVWVLLMMMGFIGGFGHWLLVLAHRLAPAPILAPFIYIGLPSITLLSWIIFGDLPSWWTLLGASIIVSSGGYLLWRER